MEQKKVTTYTLREKHGISSETIYRMKKGRGISTAMIDTLCEILDCNVEDIIQYVKAEKPPPP